MSDFASTVLIALAVMAALAILGFEGLAFKLRGTQESPLVSQLRAVAWLHSKLFHGLRIVSQERDPVPASGPAILVANHQSGVDPVFLSLATRRRVRFLMAREYYQLRSLHWLFRLLRTIPVNRDGKDLGATKAALQALQAGDVIGIFPQGGIRDRGTLDEAKAGVALLALKTGAPVIPFYIDGTPNVDSVFLAFMITSKSKILCGQPIRFADTPRRKPTREELAEVTARVLASIAVLRPVDSEESPVATE